MSYLAQSIRNAYDWRDRAELERLLLKVEALEKGRVIVMSFEHVKVGDTVTRMLAGTIPMDLKVTEVGDEFITCGGGWQFERATGMEYDPDLHWGSKWGITGSYLVKDKDA